MLDVFVVLLIAVLLSNAVTTIPATLPDVVPCESALKLHAMTISCLDGDFGQSATRDV
jgi:hypothetical protein